MDILTTLRETFFDLDAMSAALPELVRVGLPNTLILALTSAVIGTVLGMVLAVCGLSVYLRDLFRLGGCEPRLRCWPAASDLLGTAGDPGVESAS